MVDDIRQFKNEPEHERQIVTKSMPFIINGAGLIAAAALYLVLHGSFFDQWIPVVTPAFIAAHVVGMGLIVYGMIQMKLAVNRADAINGALVERQEIN